MINALPLIGWLLSAVAAVGLAVPFWICWTVFEIGEKYFGFIPKSYQAIPFWDCVGLFVVLSILSSSTAQ